MPSSLAVQRGDPKVAGTGPIRHSQTKVTILDAHLPLGLAQLGEGTAFRSAVKGRVRYLPVPPRAALEGERRQRHCLLDSQGSSEAQPAGQA